MGTKNRALLLSKEEKIFKEIQRALYSEDTIEEFDWKDTLIAGLAGIRSVKPDIIFLDEELCFPDVSSAVKEFTVKLPGVRIILLVQMGRRDKIDAAILAGAAGYLLKPMDNSEVVTTVKRVLANFTPDPAAKLIEEPPTKMGQIISLFSTLDGVGKTTIAVNLAILLSKLQGEKVCIIDADLQFGDVCRFLKLNPALTIEDFAMKSANGGCLICEYLTEYNGMVDVLAAPREPRQRQLITPALMDAAIKELACSYNYIIIDTPMGFTDVGLDILELSNVILFVNTLDSIACVKNLRLGLDALRDLGYVQEKVHLLLNRYKAKTAISVADIEKAINSRFATKIGNDFSTTSGALQTQQPMVLYQPDKEICQQMLELANRIMADNLTDRQDGLNITDRLSRWLKGKN